MNTPRLDSADLSHYLEQLAIELDPLGLWPEDERRTARRLLGTMYVGVLVDRFAARFGKERVKAEIDRRQRQRFDRLRLAMGSPCHACGATSDLWIHEFGLAQVVGSTRDWTPTLATVAAGVAMSLLGGGHSVIKGPSTTTEARICRMNLVLCAACKRKHTAMLMSRPKEQAYRLHPLWTKVEAMGFTKFLDAYALANYQ